MARNRKTLVTLTGVIAVFLALASVAYACVIFKGDLEITSSRANSDGNKVTGLGNGHGYCPGGEAVTAAKGSASDTLTVTVSKAEICTLQVTGDNKLSATQPMDVVLRNQGAYVGVDGTQWSMIQGMGCFSGVPSTTKLGSLTVDSDGYGSTTVGLSGAVPTPPGTASNLCVGKDLTGAGIMAPLMIVL